MVGGGLFDEGLVVACGLGGVGGGGEAALAGLGWVLDDGTGGGGGGGLAWVVLDAGGGGLEALGTAPMLRSTRVAQAPGSCWEAVRLAVMTLVV